MKFWITEDTHLGHKVLREYSGRPENCDEYILQNLKMPDAHDTLIHLGDICIGNDAEWHKRFFANANCRCILVRGNHDSKSLSWYMSHGWQFACDRMDLNLYGKHIAFSHKPLPDDGSFDLNIHGHFHNADHHRWEPEFQGRTGEKYKLLYQEHHYRPLSLQKIVENHKLAKDAD